MLNKISNIKGEVKRLLEKFPQLKDNDNKLIATK